MLPESPVSDFPGGSGVSDDDPADQTAAAVVLDSTFCISRTFSVQFITQLHAFYCRLCKINKVILSTIMFLYQRFLACEKAIIVNIGLSCHYRDQQCLIAQNTFPNPTLFICFEFPESPRINIIAMLSATIYVNEKSMRD